MDSSSACWADREVDSSSNIDNSFSPDPNRFDKRDEVVLFNAEEYEFFQLYGVMFDIPSERNNVLSL